MGVWTESASAALRFELKLQRRSVRGSDPEHLISFANLIVLNSIMYSSDFPLYIMSKQNWTLIVACMIGAAQSELRAELRAGCSVVDITPRTFPVLVNGGMLSRSLSKVKTPVNARALVFSDQDELVGIVVVDSCMMGRAFLDDVKAEVSKRLGLRTDRLLICATHCHSAPASMGCLGTEADPQYVPFLKDRILDVIEKAVKNLEPAQIGFARADAAEFTALRQWIRRPDRVAEDPFGNRTVRANMHAGRNWDDVTSEAGPEDPELLLLSVQSTVGRPICVLANFSMHYFGDSEISADYFGLFSEGLKLRIAPTRGVENRGLEKQEFVGMMSHGCSGDIYRVDYKVPEAQRPNLTIQQYTDGLLDIALRAYSGIVYERDVKIRMQEKRIPLKYRVPNKQLLEWSQRTVEAAEGRGLKTPTEVYAREQIILNELQKTEVVVQALSIGSIALATTPNETYAVTGLKIKAASPFQKTMVIELANGGDGYIPPPEQHPFGGYNTWPARSAGLEVGAEAKISQAAIELLERVTGRVRRPWKLPAGPAAQAILAMKPIAFWRLNEFNGPHAEDESGNHRDASYEAGVTFYLDGPASSQFCSDVSVNRASLFVGGRLRARLPELKDSYSVSLWFWNGMPSGGREVCGWIFSRDYDQGLSAFGTHIGISGALDNPGHLMLIDAGDQSPRVIGKTEVPRWKWQHLAFVRQDNRLKVYLNGQLEHDATTASTVPIEQCFFGGRSDNDSNWEGRLDEIAVFPRALTPAEIDVLAKPALQ